MEIRKSMMTDENYALLESCKTGEDWNTACSAIKKEHEGVYPTNWYHTVVLSGMMDRIASKWGGSSKITITSG